jgi:hypothetical protein
MKQRLIVIYQEFMINTLDHFRHIRLAQSFGRWRDLRARRSKTEEEANQVYVEAVQTRTIKTWCNALRRRQNESVCDNIQKERNLLITRTVFRYWRKKRSELRATRWKRAMDVKAKVLEKSHDERVARNAFEVRLKYPN